MLGSTEARGADRRTKCARRVSEANPFRRARNIAEPIDWYVGTVKWATSLFDRASKTISISTQHPAWRRSSISVLALWREHS